jgi:hypothetical protein
MQHSRSFAFAAALLLPLCSSCFAQCSQAMVQGTWGWQGHGTAMISVSGVATPMPMPFVALGTVKIDNQGSYTSHGTASYGGQIQKADWSGSIQVNPDCTATDTYTFGPFDGADRWVILGFGNEMRSFPTKLLGNPTAGVYSFRRLSWGEPQCTGDMVRGVYAGTGDGTYMIPMPGLSQPASTPFSFISTQLFQNDGSGTAANTGSMAGAIYDVTFPKLSLNVSPDCTATVSYTDAVNKQLPGQTSSGAIKYIVLDYGNELIGMETESNVGLPITLVEYKRISMTPPGSGR